MKDGVTCFKVGDLAKGNGCRLHCRRGGRHPARAFIEKALRIGICEGDWTNAGARQLQEDRMIAQDLKHGRVWKSLFVIAEQLGNVDAGENCGLAGSALWPSFYFKPRVRRHHNALVDRCRLLIREYGQRICALKTVKRIEWSTRTDPEPVDEEKQS